MTKSITVLVAEYNSLAQVAGLPIIKSWKKSKADLQKRIDVLYSKAAPKLKKPVTETRDVKSAAGWARHFKINPKVARAKLRKKGLSTDLKSIKINSEAYKIIESIESIN